MNRKIPELKGCLGMENLQIALKIVQEVSKEWLQLAKEKKWNIPEPKGRLMFA